MKRHLTFVVAASLVCMSYTVTKILNDPDAPVSYTGAPNANTGVVRYCNNAGCHEDFALNNAGGAVTATGLPTKYIAGTTYNFSIQITHATATRLNWGFAIKAVNTTNNWLSGTFTTTNANASLKGTAGTTITQQTRELSNASAPSTAATTTYTFTNLSWTAPAVPTVNDANIRFYITGNACDGGGDEVGDYVYTTIINSSVGSLPVSLRNFDIAPVNNTAVALSWQTDQEVNLSNFTIEASTDAVNWQAISTLPAAGNGNNNKQLGYQYYDKRPAAFNTQIYYRLKIIDKDGGYKYSAVKTIKLKNEDIIIISANANPQQSQRDAVYTVHSNKATPLSITVIDETGKMLYNNTRQIIVGANTVQIPAATLRNAGKLYIVRFKTEGFEKSFRQLRN